MTCSSDLVSESVRLSKIFIASVELGRAFPPAMAAGPGRRASDISSDSSGQTPNSARTSYLAGPESPSPSPAPQFSLDFALSSGRPAIFHLQGVNPTLHEDCST